MIRCLFAALITRTPILAIVLLLSLGATAQAEIFKCVGHDGQVAFQQNPCGNAQVQSTVKTTGTRWEVIDMPADTRNERATYVDVNHVAIEGDYRRVRLRTEYVQDGKIIDSEEMEHLFDCDKLRLNTLKTRKKGETEIAKKEWLRLDKDSRSRAMALSLKAKVCVSK